ncbi:ATP-dependent protease [Rhodococcoides trifolii]|uniref:ATP-dependent protease n=2 Tax=Rhodococcoides trifolii TaxID=908250 RepID=A0A917FVR2_9NOCA|nr:ATP-dependent protease [Rhodococcus trifolii]
MFPLGSVLLPGEALPLHVFEPRYRAMVDACMAADDGPRFGVVLIERGHEVGGGDTRGDIVTVAEIGRCLPLPDGRYVLECVGRTRAKVTEWLEDDPYPRAMLRDWPDEPRTVAVNLGPVVERTRTLLDILSELAAAQGEAPPSLPILDALTEDDVFALAAALPLGPSDRLRILAAPDVEARVAALADALDDVIAVAEFSRLPS